MSERAERSVDPRRDFYEDAVGFELIERRRPGHAVENVHFAVASLSVGDRFEPERIGDAPLTGTNLCGPSWEPAWPS